MNEEVASHLDVDALEMLKEIMEDDFTMLVNTFLTDAAERITQIKEAIGSKTAEDIRRASHSFKGSSANIGAHALHELCMQLEHSGSQGIVDGAEGLCESIEQEFVAVQQLLEAHYLA